MKIWQGLALISGAIVTTVMGIAAISYTATLTTPDPVFEWLPIPGTLLFGAMALAFDLGMIASVFGALHWWPAHRLRALMCCALFVIASLFSIHAVRGAIALNITKAAAPAAKAADLYASAKLDLDQAQAHLGRLQATYTTAGRRERQRLDTRIAAARTAVQEARTHLAQADRPVRVSPVDGLEWLLAIMLWVFNATCWSAWFGPPAPRARGELDPVAGWLSGYRAPAPQQCAVVFAAYSDWCRARAITPLAQSSFYGRLVALGARKFRDGRNGPTMYALPDQAS